MTKRNKNFLKIIILILCIMLFCFYKYFAKDKLFEKYYTENTQLHQELSDSLMYFSKIYKTDVLLQRSSLDTTIRFSIHFHDSAEFIPVYFDTALNRRDYKLTRTGSFFISKTIIEKFRKSIYFAIGADSTYTFFAKEWYTPFGIGTQPDLQYGILISKDTAQTKDYLKKITNKVVITTRGIL